MAFSKYNSSLTLEALQNKPEGQYLERKGRDTKPAKIANELIGMLNANGGTLVFGISDAGVVEDLLQLPERKLNDTRRIVHDLIEPPTCIDIEEVFLKDGSLIFLFHVNPNYEKRFQRKKSEDVFLRIADSNKGPLTRDEVTNLDYNKDIRRFADEVCADFSTKDLDTTLCDEYRKSMKYKDSFKQLAIKRNLAVKRNGKVFYKNGGVLLFAKDPCQYIANASVRYVRYNGKKQLSGSSI